MWLHTLLAEARNNHNPSLRDASPQLGRCPQPIHHWHPKIDEYHVGLQRLGSLDPPAWVWDSTPSPTYLEPSADKSPLDAIGLRLPGFAPPMSNLLKRFP